MESLCSIYRFLVFIVFITSSIPFAVYLPLPRMELVANGIRSSQTEIPNRNFPKFFVNGKCPLLLLNKNRDPIYSPSPLDNVGCHESINCRNGQVITS